MIELRALQECFQNFVLLGHDEMLSHVAGGDVQGARARLEVYAQAYRLRLLEALETDFPGLHGLLGDEQFEQAGRAYIDAYPSDNPSIRWFGRHMAEFLGSVAPYKTTAMLREMAAFEWAQGEVIDAKDAPLVSMEQVAAVVPEAWPQMRFELHPSVRTLGLQWNVPAIWQQIEQEQTPDIPNGPAAETQWLLWRQERITHWRTLYVDEAWALEQIASGTEFGSVCHGLCDWVPEDTVALHAASLLKRWVADSLIARISLA